MVDHPQDQKDWKSVQNFKLIDKKYYMKNHVLGKGNFAETYLATRVEDENQILACKMIAKQQIMEKLRRAPDPEGRKKYIIDALKNEVQLWKELDHPNIVKFIDFSETPNNIYFFLEYCNGGDLDKLIKRQGRLSEVETIHYFKEIVDGCDFLYKKAIIHRDLKPENILIHNGAAKIADFGFAKVIDYDNREKAATQTYVGTPYYMAPQIINGEEYSIKCDIWSLGVMLYQALYGMVPFSDKTSLESLAQKIKQAEIKFPPSIPVCNEIKELIQKMLTADEDKRISIAEVKTIMDELYSKKCQN
ncbi:plant dual-specificity MAP kinase kinase family domain protein (macronuclear) [Tetrahymena thermophila SB210]|uniref:Plant dual-specificity MAP kinase kinase family domain protein n=1 Tax=Tetrahymena thermophila (strain SB210) TaxID=312017 RepID=Q24DS8_TETTS|nr:plant dual-specificity MAP kinase kinase family domain protein [Tetrahymena thermophila SB210]EAS05912.1 plant dual-specificity MAP kinase kinase family domain protein [Tetrahymena thermophila SB210]|eukprot:XP_001026157.1 plant dual-specificity MAP kinase kinase family domain protein [Tetrahymena thermophila SB210]